MNKKLSYVKKEDRKKILLLSDDIRLHSGIATMAREIVIQTAHHFNWVNLGGAMNHPDDKKAFDISADVNKQIGTDDAYVKLYATTGYGNADIVRELIKVEKPDAIMHFTDPRYWTWLYDIEREIRQQTPLLYLNIWDDYPTQLYNKSFYECCDLLMGFSKQSVNINKMVLGEQAKGKVIEYVPHGINEEMFYPIEDKKELEDLGKVSQDMFQGKDIEFVAFFNSRNIRRKSPGDVILAYRHFCDLIGKEKAKKCALVMHTTPIDQNGTDLVAVREAICDPEYVNVFFSSNKLNTQQMNQLYNIADVTMLISSNEGWGLSLTESMMAGTPIIANVTGGMQDQMRFVDENGEWYTPSKKVPSNHMGTYKEHGNWAKPVFPSNISLVGSVPTPYIHDDRADFREIAQAIKEWYELGPEGRAEAGQAAREWVTSEESGMSATNMCKNVIESMDLSFEKFVPRQRFNIFKVEDTPKNYVQHEMVY